MKKLFDNRFLFILGLSLLVLIVLGIGAFYLFDDSDATFAKSGYVLNPLSSKVEKYYFDENVSYRENLSAMIEFKDVDQNDARVLKDSFLHYLDGSLSFLKKGAILDLDSIDGGEAVKFYNITSQSIIDKSGDKYSIKNSGKDIELKNFIGRISDNKYIVVGDLSAKLAGNETRIEGDYFEIVYVEKGIVNVENNNIKYQVTADGTKIYVGNDIVIDLGDKKVSSNGKDIMSLTAITIDGNENIEIIPEGKGTEEDNKGEQGDDNQNTPGSDGNDGNNGNGNDGNGSGNGGNGNADGQKIDEIVVSLKEASVKSTGISVVFDMYNNKPDDSFTLKVTNLDSGRTVDVYTNVVANQEIDVSLLSPNTKYLFTVVNERDDGKYFQKIFETSDFGISLERSYATSEELGFKITVAKGTDITNAKLTLYKFNEETKQNEVVTTTYYDSVEKKTKTVQKVTYLSSLQGNIEGVHEVIYDGLDSNTIYTAVLDEFSLASSNFKDIYNITLTSLTLKEKPTFNNMKVDKSIASGSFKLSIEDIEDPDSAITGYTYLIYETSNPNKTVIEPITKSNASPIEVMIGDGENQLKNDVNYFYKVVIEYFDNEKYIEYITTDSINFVMGGEPHVTIVPDETKISYDSIGATIYLTDNSCFISMPGREKCDGENSTVINVNRIDPVTGARTLVYKEEIDFEVGEDGIKYNFYKDELEDDTMYSIEIKADLNYDADPTRVPIESTEQSKDIISTKSLTDFINTWDSLDNLSHVINVKSKFSAVNGTGNMTPDESAAAIKKVVVKLYEGSNIDNLSGLEPIDTKNFYNNETFNIKEEFYDKGYVITNDNTFGLSLNDLKEKGTPDKLSEYYTIVLEAYFDEQETNPVNLQNNIIAYAVNPFLLADNIKDPQITTDPISNSALQNAGVDTKLINEGTTVGYKVTIWNIDRDGMESSSFSPESVNLYVYNERGKKVKFYVMNDAKKLVLVDKITDTLGNNDYYESKIYMDYGTEYSVVDDDIMRRGNKYYVGYEIVVVSSMDNTKGLYPKENKERIGPSATGIYDVVESDKETPDIKMYVAKSTENKIIYQYKIEDPDNALYRESQDASYGFYYTIGNSQENKLNITKKDDGTYGGRITIEGLEKNDIYSLYYKKNIKKSGNLEEDVHNYPDEDGSGKRRFEGLYTFNTSDLEYEVINNESGDNQVIIKVLAAKTMIERILNYKVTFKAGSEEEIAEAWKLSSCVEMTNRDIDSEDDINRCFSVDYNKLKSMKNKTIDVSVEAFYDNGLMGYDYDVWDGTSENTQYDYKYMIMQNNLAVDGSAKYIILSSGTSNTPSVWSEELGVGTGYYIYSPDAGSIVDKGLITYHNMLNDKAANLSYNLTSLGYRINLGTINPKMISTVPMKPKGANTFSFSSIVPKVTVGTKSQLINGGVVNLTLTGADLTDFKKEDGEYYLYIDTWADEESANNESNNKVRPQLKIKIDKNDPSRTVEAVIDGLREESTYYFNVYAKMKKGSEWPLTRLNDSDYRDEYKPKTHSITSISGKGRVTNLIVDYSINDSEANSGGYGKRDLDTTMTLKSYIGEYPFNYDVLYVFCNAGSDCVNKEGGANPIIEDEPILYRTVPKENVAKTLAIKDDISSKDLEFGKRNGYRMYVYAVVDYYDDGNLIKRYVPMQVEGSLTNVSLSSLTEPDFTVERNALIVDGEYAIRFDITPTDPSRTLTNGVYHVDLLDSNGQSVGTMKILEGSNYVPTGNNEFSAFDLGKVVLFTGLNAHTKYTVAVYGEAYVNNYSETIPKEERRYEARKTHTVYSVNNYGVGFGNNVLYSATEKSVVATFLGGSNFDNVVQVRYTIGLWDDNNSTSISGKYIKGTSGFDSLIVDEETIPITPPKAFVRPTAVSNWRFVIDPPGMKIVLGEPYDAILSFVVKNPNFDPANPDDPTNPEYVTLTHETDGQYSSFRGSVQYDDIPQ